ncbi:MAG: ATP-binding cassette domain-containing protein [Planctomycetota bacterium]
MLELEAVSKSWGDFALCEVSLWVEEGEYFVLLGPSGAGKSLLLEVVAGFHSPDRGGVRLGGRDVTGVPPERRGIGFVYQDSMLFPHKTAAQNIAYGLRLRGCSPAQARRTTARLAEMLHIGGLLERSPTELSGGEKQRVSLARALAVEPDMLLMDEPLGALDPLTAKKLRGELKRVHRQTGVSVLHVTHDQAEARELGERVGVLSEGRLLQVDETDRLFERPASRFVAEFTGFDNIYHGRAEVRNGVAFFHTGQVELVSTECVEGPACAVIRPDNVFLSAESVRTSARNQFRARVTRVEQRGHVYAVTGRFQGVELTALITDRSRRELDIRTGREVYFSFKAHALHLVEETASDGEDR